MKTKFESSASALKSLMPIIEAIDNTLTCGIFACEAMGSLTIEFSSSTAKGDADKIEAQKMVGRWLEENGVALENEAEGFRMPSGTDWAIESDWWTTEEFE